MPIKFNGERIISLTNDVGTNGFPYKRMKLDHFLSPYKKLTQNRSKTEM